MNLEFRSAAERDIPAMGRIIDAAYAPAVKRMFGDSPRGRWMHYDESRLRSYITREAEGMRLGSLNGYPVTVNICRSYGSLGWFHSLAVHPNYQQRGLGREAIADAAAYLTGRGVSVLGLMTWPDAVSNIGLYLDLGFRAVGVSVHAYRDTETELTAGPSPIQADFLSGVAAVDRPEALRLVVEICQQVLPGLDYTPWLVWTLEQRLGDALLFWRGDRLLGFALCYLTRFTDWLEGRVLALSPAASTEERVWALEWVRRWAAQQRRGSFGFPLDVHQSESTDLLHHLGFRLFRDSMINFIRGEPWPPAGVHLVRFSG